MLDRIFSFRPARFALVGCVATLVHALILGVLVETAGLSPTAANLIAFLTAFGVSYFGHRRITFQSETPHRKAAPGFFLAAMVGLFTNLALFFVLTDVFDVNYWLVFVLALIIAPALVYVIARDHAFGTERQRTKPEDEEDGSEL